MTRGITAKKIVSFGSMILLFVLIVGYGVWRARDVLFGINFTVSGIYDGMTTTGAWLDLSGSAPNTNNFTIDGRTVPTAQNGSWQDTIVLLGGYNVITVSATDKFGKVSSRQFRVYYDAPAAPVIPVPTSPLSSPSDTTSTPAETLNTAIPTNPTSSTSPATTPAVQ